MVKHRFTVEAYRKAYEAGALPERVELLEGEVYAVSPMGKRHRLYAMHLDRLFQKALGSEAVVMVQCPLPLSETSEPVPDLVARFLEHAGERPLVEGDLVRFAAEQDVDRETLDAVIDDFVSDGVLVRGPVHS